MENFFLELAQAAGQVAAVVFKALSPLITGLVLAYLFNRPVEWVRSKISGGSSDPLLTESPKGRGAALAITYTAVFIIILLFIYAFVILILGSLPSGGIEETARRVYEYFSSSYNSIMSFISEHLPEHMAGDGQDPGAVLSQWLGDNFSMTRLVRAAAGVAGSLVSFFVGLVASVYLLKDKEFFLSLWQKFLFMILKQKPHGIVNEVLGEINTVLITFVKGALVDSMIVALLYSAVLSLLQVRFAVVIGLLGGILNIIPYFGPFFSMIPAFLAALATGGLAQAVFSVLALLGIQQVDSNFIYPKDVGTSIGLHPLFVLLSVSIFGYFGGVAGMLLAVPAAGIIQVLVKKWAYGR